MTGFALCFSTWQEETSVVFLVGKAGHQMQPRDHQNEARLMHIFRLLRI